VTFDPRASLVDGECRRHLCRQKNACCAALGAFIIPSANRVLVA
jgi:hypothetical protein